MNDRKKFRLADELKSIREMSQEELCDFQLDLEQSIVLLEAQLECYDNGIKTDEEIHNTDHIWYKQANYVYHGKRLLLRKVSNMLLDKPSTHLETLINSLHAIGASFETRDISKHTIYLTVQGAEGRVSFVFQKGELIDTL